MEEVKIELLSLMELQAVGDEVIYLVLLLFQIKVLGCLE